MTNDDIDNVEYLFYRYDDQGPSWDYGGPEGVGGGVLNPFFRMDQVNIFRGIHIAGDQSDIFASDDAYMKFQPGITLSPTEPPVWLELERSLPFDNPGSLQFILEAATDTVSITQTVELYNWNSGQYEQTDSRAASLNTDSVTTVDLTDQISDYVETGTRNVKARVGLAGDGNCVCIPVDGLS